jgi:hypothetical protein
MSLLETVRNALTPGISYPMVTLFPGGPIGNEVGLNTSPGQDAEREGFRENTCPISGPR